MHGPRLLVPGRRDEGKTYLGTGKALNTDFRGPVTVTVV